MIIFAKICQDVKCHAMYWMLMIDFLTVVGASKLLLAGI
jgi:hypothetical protein